MRALRRLTFATTTACLMLSSVCAQSQSNLKHTDLETETVKASISEFLYQSIQPQFVDQPIPCKEIHSAVDASFVRGAVDLIILCDALIVTSPNTHLSLSVTSGYRRARTEVESGRVDLMAETAWASDLNPGHATLSTAVIPKNSFKKGVFTLPEHALQTLPAKNIDLSMYRGITLRNWHEDWKLINRLTSKVLNAGPQYTLYRMMEADRADFTIMELSVKNRKGFTYSDITIKPIEGVYVVFDSSRHFLISQKATHAETLTQAINTGLETLRKDNKIERLYEAWGHQSPIPENWIDLSPNGGAELLAH